MAKATKGTPAVIALDAATIAYTLHAYAFDGSPGQIGLQAAAAMGVAPGRVFKTLVAVVDDQEPVVAMLAVDRELDLKALAKAAGGKRAAMADVAMAERATGYVKGGISPLGQRRRLRSFLDAAALDHSTIIVNGGRRGLQVELAPGDLLAITGGVSAPLARSC
jgi:Cys-tRNA(Pro)/Cys-tRNA(Cys) deacylase